MAGNIVAHKIDTVEDATTKNHGTARSTIIIGKPNLPITSQLKNSAHPQIPGYNLRRCRILWVCAIHACKIHSVKGKATTKVKEVVLTTGQRIEYRRQHKYQRRASRPPGQASTV